jgi:hypothetical protein
MNILYKTGSAGIITVGTYSTSTEPVYDNYYATSDITVGIVTSTSLNVVGLTTTKFLVVSGISTLGVVSATSLNVSGISTVGLGTTSTPPSNSQMSFELISNTSLRIKVRGTDGVLRSANITLS